MRIRPGSPRTNSHTHPSDDADRPKRTLWEQFKYSPIILLAHKAYEACLPRPPALSNEGDLQTEGSPERARIVCISDTHSAQDHLPPLPPGDVLIHAGDLTIAGTAPQLDAAFAWIHAAPHEHKIVIAGNHDRGLTQPTTRDALLAKYPSITYLEDSLTTVEVRGRLLSVYGSPHSLRTRGCTSSDAFQNPVEPRPLEIPHFIDVLVTHGPPMAHLDWNGRGSSKLLTAVRRVRPQLHVFGHIHAGRGVECVTWDNAQRMYEVIYSQKIYTRKKNYLRALSLVAAALGTMIRGRPKFLPGAHTMFVNASSQGWFRDTVWRGATVVDIRLPP